MSPLYICCRDCKTFLPDLGRCVQFTKFDISREGKEKIIGFVTKHSGHHIEFGYPYCDEDLDWSRFRQEAKP